jgi:putative transposase
MPSEPLGKAGHLGDTRRFWQQPNKNHSIHGTGAGQSLSADWQTPSGTGLVKKKDWASTMSVAEKRTYIDPQHATLSIARQCDLVGLPRSSYYRPVIPQTESAENLQIMALIDEEYTKYPFFGSRKIRDVLRRLGYNANRKRIQRLMRKMGIASIAPKPNLSKPHPEHTVYPYLLRNLPIVCPDQVWSTDITYVPFSRGFVYLQL